MIIFKKINAVEGFDGEGPSNSILSWQWYPNDQIPRKMLDRMAKQM
jgi:hypothetical protein